MANSSPLAFSSASAVSTARVSSPSRVCLGRPVSPPTANAPRIVSEVTRGVTKTCPDSGSSPSASSAFLVSASPTVKGRKAVRAERSGSGSAPRSMRFPPAGRTPSRAAASSIVSLSPTHMLARARGCAFRRARAAARAVVQISSRPDARTSARPASESTRSRAATTSCLPMIVAMNCTSAAVSGNPSICMSTSADRGGGAASSGSSATITMRATDESADSTRARRIVPKSAVKVRLIQTSVVAARKSAVATAAGTSATRTVVLTPMGKRRRLYPRIQRAQTTSTAAAPRALTAGSDDVWVARRGSVRAAVTIEPTRKSSRTRSTSPSPAPTSRLHSRLPISITALPPPRAARSSAAPGAARRRARP